MKLYDHVRLVRECPQCGAGVDHLDGYVFVCRSCTWAIADPAAAFAAGRPYEPNRVLAEVASLQRTWSLSESE